jgi:predicted nucleic acid-binding protein
MSRRPARQPEVAYGDTNAFIALLEGPSHPLHEQALGVFRRVADGELRLLVTSIVVAELVYVSRGPIGWSRRVVADRLSALLQADGVVLTERATILRALALYGAATRLDFADAYLAAAALEVGPPVVASFDAEFDTITGIRRIAA